MRFSLSMTARMLVIAGLALGAAACGRSGTPAANNATTLNTSSEIGIGNDASAMETVGNAPAPAALPTDTSSTPTNTSGRDDADLPPLPVDTAPGGDTGGNSTRGVQSNVSGM